MRRALFVLTLPVLFLEAALAAAQTPVERTRPAAADGFVDIENASGSIKVVGWDKNEILVRGTLGRRAEGLELSGTGNRTRIKVQTRDNAHAVRSDFEISVPAGSQLRIESFDASIAVSGVTGSVNAETVNGAITHSGAAKEVALETVNGSVEVTKAAGRVRASAVNGSVSVREVKGTLEASTVNGRLTVSDSVLDRAQLETVSGSVRFEGALGERATLDAEAVSGSIEFVLPPKTSADFELSTFSGRIETQWGSAPTKASHSPEKRVSFSTGSGGATITAHTLSGNISVSKVQ